MFDTSAGVARLENVQHRSTSASNQNNNQNIIRNPHYENIYESIDQFATVNAPAPAENVQNAQLPAAAALSSNNNNTNNNNNNGRINLRTRNHFPYNTSSLSHPRNGAYDVPRHTRNYYSSNASTANRRATLDVNPNRIRYANANRAAFRQRSFDDTESYHYSRNNNFRYENIYEQIREEPIYRNISMNRDNAANRLYGGRLDVIGHGIGRIERHLSSSCGNIDHYNINGTYAILGHSHLSTVGHVYASNNTKETAGKSVNFFSCLGRENSQSMSNICRESSNGNNNSEQPAAGAGVGAGAAAPVQPPPTQNENTNKHTGAIPKLKNKMQNTARNTPNTMHSSALNRISKSSLQWLLMNKWLPLWIGNGSDCNVLDFNFMFSRNCDGCRDDGSERGENLESNGASLYANYYRDFGQDNYYSISRPMLYNNNLMRFNETNPHRMSRSNRQANYRSNQGNNSGYGMNDLPYNFRAHPQPENPFRRWELNSENNSFRPASVRRITDGTFPNGNQNQAQFQLRNQGVHVEVNHQPIVDTNAPSTSSASRPVQSTSNSSNAEASSSAQLRADRRVFENAALSSSTESASETENNKILSPDLSARRYSENTEDDQYNSGNSSSTDEEENDETISEMNTNDTDFSERINEQ